MDLILAVFAFFGACVCGGVASARGRSGIGWFLVGLLIWPVALIFLLVLPRNQKVVEKRQIEDGELVRCSQCAELIRPDARICKHCRSPVEQKVVALRPDDSGEQPRPTSKGMLAVLTVSALVVAAVVAVTEFNRAGGHVDLSWLGL